jgi:hypothetical protein
MSQGAKAMHSKNGNGSKARPINFFAYQSHET